MPGPLAPSSHLGVTLQRHLLAAALRYALYHLGLPMPEKPPVRIERLRLYLETAPLLRLLEATPGAAAVAAAMTAALVDPAGAGPAPRGTKLAIALALHRLRLWRHRPLRGPASPHREGDDPPARLWQHFRKTLTATAPRLGDALLAEVAAAIARRDRRATGRSVTACRSRAAARFLAGKPVPLAGFGAPDLRQPSWAQEPERAELTRAEFNRCAPAIERTAVDRYRGRYRLSLRAALDQLRPIYLDLASQAADRGVIERPDDAFFMPLDLAECLTGARRPGWLDAAVASNRAELVRLFDGPEPRDRIDPGDEPPPADPARWELAPLLPLP